MDQAVYYMLNLVKGEADCSFKKKAEMWCEKQPELINQLEDFLRSYRALAERYDRVTRKLHENVSRQLEYSEGSGTASDFGSESLDSLNIHRASGFDVFLGSEHSRKGRRWSSPSSGTQSDSSEPTLTDQFSGPGDNGNHFELQETINMQLDESELFDTKDHLKLQARDQGRKLAVENGSHEAANIKISKLQDALIKSNEKARALEVEIARLKFEVDQNQSPGLSGTLILDFIKTDDQSFDVEDKQPLVESADLEFECNRERQQLEVQIAALKTEVSNRERTIEELKAELSSSRTDHYLLQEKLQMKLEIIPGNLSESREAELSLERKRVSHDHVEEEIVKLNALVSDRESTIVDLETRISEAYETYSEEKHQLAGEISTWKESHSALKSRFMLLEDELNQLKAGENLEKERQLIERLIITSTEERGLKDKRMEKVLINNKEYYYDTVVLEAEKKMNEQLFGKMQSLEAARMCQMDEHLNRLHMEHMQLIKGCEDAKAAAAELSGRVKELEEEVERQRVVIADNAELKREAIRQLCITLEHYRDGYEKLKQLALHGHSRAPTVSPT
ncbi:hypothetical protein H6P81_014620 [Aristolochia fimbriata]|uniref:NAB domain-containing protein n=1 Tax=Aristolochia fimbriata TaxID=158543 RepID=A0AAV7E2W6_ARIFI|nr:hypothetical protein H6P81_014620 [Aristolochia fimbriata]